MVRRSCTATPRSRSIRMISSTRTFLRSSTQNPGYKWILFGDTGEKDPEVYRTLMQERPGTVAAVFIHNVTSADPQHERFTGFTVFTDWEEVLAASRSRN